MKTTKRHLIILIALLLSLLGTKQSYTQNGPISDYSEVVYFNLDAGDVTITASTYTGYKWSGTSAEIVTGPTSSSTLYYIYQARPGTSWGPDNLPQYPAVTTTSGATGNNALNIVDNTNVSSVISGWNTKVNANNNAQSDNNYKRYATLNRISVTGWSRINICLDNVWSEYQDYDIHRMTGGLSVYSTMAEKPYPDDHYCQFHVYLKGDNRLGNVFYTSQYSGHTYTDCHLVFHSYAGDSNTAGTLTVADISATNTYYYNSSYPQSTYNFYNSVIGASDHSDYQDADGIEIRGGTIYAGALKSDNCTAIGGGGNGLGRVKIFGGTVTAVTESTGTAIGGGIGWSSTGGVGDVTITGGRVYAYNKCYGQGTGDGKYVPASAIGGASSYGSDGSTGTVNISGGTVYAETVYGTAIGGGGSSTQNGGDANVTISSSANVTAKSVDGTINGHSLSAGTSIGGGTGFRKGGNVTFNMTGGTLKTGSVGGGKKTSASNEYGSGTVTIEGGTINGQFVLSPPSSGSSTFTMKGGTIGGKLSGFAYMQPDGYAVWMNDSHGTVTINQAVGTSKISGCTGAVNGGAIYMRAGTLTLTEGTIEKCSATNGGAVYMGGGTFNMNGGTIGGNSDTYANQATGKGGGIFMGGGSFTMTGGTISYNKTTNSVTDSHGGGVYIASGGTVTIQGGTISNNTAKAYGGGFYVDPGPSRTTTINSNTSNTLISGNSAIMGGGAYIKSGTLSASATSSGTVKIQSNTATTSGGGVFVETGTINTSGANIESNTATNGNGGGIYAVGAVTITGGTVNGNHADKNAEDCGLGGGIYAQAGNKTITIQSGSSITGNTAQHGAGLYAASGTVYVKTNSTITSNAASQNGGGIYANGGTVNVSATTITKEILKQNTAVNGGGIYANGGTVNFSNGVIKGNYASEKGGGIYIPSNGTLNLYGTATISLNRVPQSKLGGGVYLEGTVQAGALSTDVIIVKDNYASNTVVTSSNDVTASIRNNIYLPNPTDNIPTSAPPKWAGVITVVNNGLNLTDSKIGFSVPHNFIPVIYCQTAYYLQSTIMSSNAIFEDSERYNKYYSNTSPYKGNFIYLSANTWVSQVTSQPSSGFTVDGSGNVTISNEQGLAWLISYVNGLNDVTDGAHTMENCTVTLTADLDMKANSWVPIGMTGTTGTTDKPFKGTFNGNGHTVSNLYCSYLGEGNAGTGSGLGMFGVLDGATVHDVFLNGIELQVHNQQSGTFVMGAIANEIKGNTSIYNCTASSNMESTWANTTMGGLVGKLTSGTIHSSAAMPDMTGYTMGGLVGTMASGTTLYNSFANPKFTYSGAADAYFVGGLVAENNGTVQNCYVRFSRQSSFGNSAKFGRLAGSAGSNLISLCYTPTTCSTVPTAIQNMGTVSNCATYGDVVAPYLYAYSESADNIVSGTSNTLCKQLNAWVSTNNSTSGRPTCASWKRTTAGGYSYTYNNVTVTGGDINGDYPIHEFEEYTCAASTNGVDLDYAKSLDDMLTRHTSDATINLYANENNVTKSTGNNEVVYIDENVSLLQGTASRITAYTGQTLRNYNDNRWHNVSSSLKQSGIGFDYYNDGHGQHADFNWDINPCNIALSRDDDNAFFPSDLPWPTTPTTAEMDFYCFYEPEYHWINLKRRTDSHWHMDANEERIYYNGNGLNPAGGHDNENETYMVPGKGYLVSIDKDQLIQNKGELNNGTVTLYSVTKTDANEWAGLLGYNLLGNPYQSYLDFEVFKTTNSGLWAGTNEYNQTYATFDPEQNAYRQYFGGTSSGATVASRYIHPHQGFFIRKTAANSGNNTVTFTNDMRTNTTNGQSGFRGAGQPRHALVNFVVRDAQGKGDIAVLELNRDGDEGAEKIRMGDGTGHLSLGYDGKAYAILFRTKVEGYQPLWFEATEAGTFTLRWDIHNAVFESLTLVDNITGTSTDMLATDTYTFQGSPDHYASRFKVVIGDYVEVDPDEPTEPEPVEGPTFAFIVGDELVVDGEGTLQVFDVMGRQLSSTTLSGTRSTMSLPAVAAGVYVLRLTNDNGTKVQKIVFGN